MTQTNNPTSRSNPATLIIRVLVGAIIGLLVISLFVFPVIPNPEWGKYWIIRPLIITPLAGAMGGLCNYLLVRFHSRVGLNKLAAMILSVIVFIIGLWLGIVLGLAGTLWD